MEKPQKWFAYCDMKKHISSGQITDVFFIGYFCLLIITTNAIIKANVMIVTTINE